MQFNRISPDLVGRGVSCIAVNLCTTFCFLLCMPFLLLSEAIPGCDDSYIPFRLTLCDETQSDLGVVNVPSYGFAQQAGSCSVCEHDEILFVPANRITSIK